MRRSARTNRRRLASLAVLGAIAVVGAGCIPVAPPAPTVIFYGDSLLVEARGVIATELATLKPGYRALTYGRSFGGTALCDWGGHMLDDTDENVKLVVIQFSGNNFTACAGGVTGAALEARYRAWAEWTVGFWTSHGAKVLFVGSPTLRVDDENPQPPNPISEVFRSVAEAHPQSAVFDAGPERALGKEVPVEPPPDSTTTTTTTTTEPEPEVTTTTTTEPEVTTTTTEPEVTTETQPDEPPIGLEVLPADAPAEPGWLVFPFQLPCLSPTEPGCGSITAGLVPVRWAAPSPTKPLGDGHLCTGIPMGMAGDATCPAYRSGVQRFGRAIALAVAANL